MNSAWTGTGLEYAESVVSNPKPFLWVTANGRAFFVRDMDTGHIKAILKCLTGKGLRKIPNPYIGLTNEEWISIFKKKLCCR